jgi:hypothetical protein
MKKSLVFVAVTLAIAGCSSRAPKVDTVREEVLSREMVTPEIEVTHSGCGLLSKAVGRDCKVVRIDSTATAPSNGGTTVLRSVAFQRACDTARANIAHWMGERVTSDRVSKITGASVEKADSVENQASTGESQNYETSRRENGNDTKLDITNTIRVQSAKYLTGWKSIKDGSPVIGDQEVKCVMRWDAGDEVFLRQLSMR